MNMTMQNLKAVRDGIIALIQKTQEQVTNAFNQCAPSATASVVGILKNDSINLLADLEVQRLKDLANRRGPNATSLREQERIQNAYLLAKTPEGGSYFGYMQAEDIITTLTPTIYGTFKENELNEKLQEYFSFVTPELINAWNAPLPVSSHEDLRITHEYGQVKIYFRERQKSGCKADTILELHSRGLKFFKCELYDVLEEEQYNGGPEFFNQELFLKIFLEYVAKPTPPAPLNLKEEIESILRADPLPAGFAIANQKANETLDGLKDDRYHYWETDIEGVPHWTVIVSLGRAQDSLRFNGIQGHVSQWFFTEKYMYSSDQAVLHPNSHAAFLAGFKAKREHFMQAVHDKLPHIFDGQTNR